MLLWLVASCSDPKGGETRSAGDSTAPDTGDTGDTGGAPFPEPALDDCITEGSDGHHVFACNGIDFDVEVPSACLERACGLVFDVHGFTESADIEDKNTELRRQASEYETIVVQPNAEPDPPWASWDPETDDAIVLDFLDRAVAAWHVDPDRVHFTGFSQGGFMTWRFLCAHADRFASVAPAAAGLDCGYAAFDSCAFDGAETPSVEIPVLMIHGTVDAVVEWECALRQRDALIDAWDMEAAAEVASDSDYTWTRYENAAGTVFEFIEHDYSAQSSLLGGHCYVGSEDTTVTEEGQAFAFACEGPNAFHWGEAAMQFFEENPG